METILEFKEVDYTYAGAARETLTKVNAAFEKSKLYVIYGPSGSGKTTALALAGALDVPTSGQVLYGGTDIRADGLRTHRKNHVAFIFQNYNLLGYMTALENITAAMDITAAGGDTAAERKTLARALLTELGLQEDEISRNVLKLSGGQQQRVAIARALASNADIILADEPTGNLDPDTAKGIVDILQKLAHERGKCVIAVSHSAELAKAADEVLTIKSGALVPVFVVRSEDETVMTV